MAYITIIIKNNYKTEIWNSLTKKSTAQIKYNIIPKNGIKRIMIAFFLGIEYVSEIATTCNDIVQTQIIKNNKLAISDAIFPAFFNKTIGAKKIQGNIAQDVNVNNLEYALSK